MLAGLSADKLNLPFILYAPDCSGPACDALSRTMVIGRLSQIQASLLNHTGKSQITLQDCLNAYHKDPSFSGFDLNLCASRAARVFNDSALCVFVPNSYSADNCVASLAYASADPSLCDELGETGEPSQRPAGDIQKLSYKSQCYFHLGAIAADKTACNKGEQMMNKAIRLMPDPEIRAAASESGRSIFGSKDECLSQVAIQTHDSALCAQTFGPANDWCQYRIAHPSPPAPYCRDEVVLYLNDNYWADAIRWLAKKDDGSTVLSWWDYGSSLDCSGLHSVVSLNHSDAALIGQVAYLYSRGNESELADFMRQRGAKYAIFGMEDIATVSPNGELQFGGKFDAINFLGCSWSSPSYILPDTFASACEQENKPEKVIFAPNQSSLCQPDNRSEVRGQVAYRLNYVSGNYEPSVETSPSYCLVYAAQPDGLENASFYLMGARDVSGRLPKSSASWFPMPDRGSGALFFTAAYPGPPERSSSESPSKFYNSILYKAVILGRLDGFERVYNSSQVMIYKLGN